MNPHGPAYAGHLPEEEIVETLSKAAGHWGSCAEYLLHTVENLERHGIRDRMLWKIQAAVAERIAATALASQVGDLERCDRSERRACR